MVVEDSEGVVCQTIDEVTWLFEEWMQKGAKCLWILKKMEPLSIHSLLCQVEELQNKSQFCPRVKRVGVCVNETQNKTNLLTDVHQHFYTPLAASDNLYMEHLTGFEKGLKQMFPV